MAASPVLSFELVAPPAAAAAAGDASLLHALLCSPSPTLAVSLCQLSMCSGGSRKLQHVHVGPGGFSSLHAAALRDWPEAVPPLLAAGAPLNAQLESSSMDLINMATFSHSSWPLTHAQQQSLLRPGCTPLVLACRWVRCWRGKGDGQTRTRGKPAVALSAALSCMLTLRWPCQLCAGWTAGALRSSWCWQEPALGIPVQVRWACLAKVGHTIATGRPLGTSQH
jgi:hypothetical protein